MARFFVDNIRILCMCVYMCLLAGTVHVHGVAKGLIPLYCVGKKSQTYSSYIHIYMCAYKKFKW